MYLNFRKTGETVPEGAPHYAGYPILTLEGAYPNILEATQRHYDDQGVPTLHVEEYDENAVPGCVVVVGELARYVVRTTLADIDDAVRTSKDAE